MPTPRAPRSTMRLNVELRLTRSERRAFDALCVAELRTPGRMASRIVAHHLAQRSASLPAHPIPRGERERWSVQVRLTPAQRRALEARAEGDGRSLSNYVTALVVRALGEAGR